MFDAHRHISDCEATENALYATSSPSEWPSLLSLGSSAVGGIGILPSEFPGDPDAVYEMLVSHPDLQIAEVGLDRRYPNRETQRTFLAQMLHMGFELGRSVSLHCVRENGLLLTVLRNERKYLPPLLWHGCTASFETIAEAVRYQVIPSYGPNIYKSNLRSRIQQILELPFALETDFTGFERDYAQLFANHIAAFCSLSGYSEEQLENHNDEIRTILTHNKTSR